MPKISVIIPVYNTEKYLSRCLNSIVNQTFKDIEVIIINDGSTDNSEKIIEEYKNQYYFIKYFKTKNLGVSNARNLGIQNVRGEYFCFVDSDDFIDLNLFENLSIYLKGNLDLIKYKTKILDTNLNILNKIDGPIFENFSGEIAFNTLCFNDVLIDTPCLYLFNTSFFAKNDFKFLLDTYHEDFGLIPLVILKSKGVVSINIFGYNYVQADNSITRTEDYSKTLKKCYDLLEHYDNMIEQISKIDLMDITNSNIKQYYTNAILSATKKLAKKDKKSYVSEILSRKLVSNIKIRNLKSFIKKLYVELYLKTI